MPIIPRVDIDEICGIGARKPLLLWLIGGNPQEITRLVDKMKQSYFTPDARWDSFVWGMLNMCGKLGDGRLFTFEGLRPEGRRGTRFDLDVLADVQGGEPDFIHHLVNRINVPGGFTSKDVVLVWGNFLLSKLNAVFRRYFTAHLLCVDNSPIERLQMKCGVIDVLEDVTGEGLRKWIEQRAHGHYQQMRVSDPGFFAGDPYFSETLTSAQMPWAPLEGLSVHSDALMIKESFVPIPPRRTKVEHINIGSDDECSHDGETYTGIVARKRERAPALTPELTSDALSAWVAANLEPKIGGKYSYTELKKMIESVFKQGKPSDGLMKLAGITYAGGNRWVKNLRGDHLVLRSSASSSSGSR